LADTGRDESATLIALSNAVRTTNPVVAAKLALAAWPRSDSDAGAKLDVTIKALSAPVIELCKNGNLTGHDVARIKPAKRFL
jgi:hypothetical protein